MFTRFVALGVLGLLCAVASGLPAGPSVPTEYDATIRYRIEAVGNDRLAQYFAMLKHLKQSGFVRTGEVAENEPEDAKASRMRGTIPADKVNLLFGDRRVKSVRLLPRGVAAPTEKDKLVRVNLRLAGAAPAARQRLLAEQVRQVLTEIGFGEAVGYDHRGFTRLLGSIPAGQLDALLEDLRQHPGGAAQPAPFATQPPVVVTEVQPGLPLPAVRTKPVAIPPGQERLSPELRELLSDDAKAAVPTRMEVVLAAAPNARDRNWMTSSLPGVIVEGRLGPLVTVLARPSEATDFAAVPEVAGVRLPRPGQSQVLDASREGSARLLVGGEAAKLHVKNRRGKGTRLAIVDADFRGWQAQVGKGLPTDTRLVDLTCERNRSLEPDAFPGSGAGPGTGTRCALAAAQIAPEAELTLIRIDAAAPYQLESVARAIAGDPGKSLNMDRRLSEMEQQRLFLNHRREELDVERRAALEDFTPEGEETQQRKDYIKKQAAFDRDERDLTARAQRYRRHEQALLGLKGIRVVACGLSWPDGYPVDGSSTLSRYFDDRPFRQVLWFQCAGDTRGQAWTGIARDADGNGVMEFAPPDRLLPPGAWTPELNFLAWLPASGARVRDLPANARVRLSLLWREPHDSAVWRSGEDAYRDPIAELRLVVVRQADPSGAKQPLDDLEFVAQSVGAPLRIEKGPNAGAYEQTVELRVATPGRYAVRIEGKLPDSDSPRGAATLPSQRRTIEIRPRLFLTTVHGDGRAVFEDFATEAASIGMPGDAHFVTTIGAVDVTGNRQPYSAGGPPHNLELLLKPDALAADAPVGGAGGTGLAAARAAGFAAALRSDGRSLAAIQEAIKANAGGLLRAPEGSPNR